MKYTGNVRGVVLGFASGMCEAEEGGAGKGMTSLSKEEDNVRDGIDRRGRWAKGIFYRMSGTGT